MSSSEFPRPRGKGKRQPGAASRARYKRLTDEQLAKGREIGPRFHRAKHKLRKAVAAREVDGVELIVGLLDDEVFDDGFTYWKLIKKQRIWNVVMWVHGIRETRAVQIFTLCEVGAGKFMWQLRPVERERVARAIEVLLPVDAGVGARPEGYKLVEPAEDDET